MVSELLPTPEIIEPWPMWLSWLECHLVDRTAMGSIPSQGTGPGLHPNQCFSLPSSLSLSTPLLKTMKKMFLGENVERRLLRTPRSFGLYGLHLQLFTILKIQAETFEKYLLVN